MLYALQTLPGLAALAWQEAETRLPVAEGKDGPAQIGTRIVPGRNDILLVRYEGDPKALLRLRCIEDVFAVAARAFAVAPDERGLRQCYAAVRNTRDIEGALKAWRRVTGNKRPPNTFRVIAREIGAHKFLRRDMGRAVGDAIADAWPGRWRRVDEEGDVEIWATLVENELLCGLRLSGPEMRQRGKLRHLPASLRPALAAAMVMLTNPLPDDVFLDPMAGAGTLLVERAAAGPFRAIYGGDVKAEAVGAMRTNTRGLKGEIRCERWDARSLPLDDASVDKVAVNLPFGKQIAGEEDLPTLYRSVMSEIQRVLRPGGRLVALVGDARALEAARAAAARGLRSGPRHRVEVLGKMAWICEFNRQ